MSSNLLSQSEIDEVMSGLSYMWEPTDETLYGGDMASYTLGMFYERMTVERSKEGWHGALYTLSLRNDDDGGSFEYDLFPDDEDDMFILLDEELFPTEQEAMDWCARKDQKATATA